MADHPGSPSRWVVRGAFAATQCLIAVTVYLALDDGPTAAVVALSVLSGAFILATLGGGLVLDVVRPRALGRQRRRAARIRGSRADLADPQFLLGSAEPAGHAGGAPP